MDLPSALKLAPTLLPLLILLAGGLRREPSGESGQPFSTQNWNYWDLVLVMALLTAIGLLPIADSFPERLRWARLPVYFLRVLIPLGAILALVRWRYGLPISALGFRRRHAAYYAVWGLSVVSGIVFVTNALRSLIARGESPFRASGATELWSRIGDSILLLEPSALFISAMTLLYIIVIVPVFEEIFFRGFSYPPCARRFGVAGAAIMTTAVWSLGHGHGAVDILKISLMGLAFARIYRRTQSLLPTIVLHMALNCAASVMAWADSFRNVVNVFPLVSLGALAILIPSVITLVKVAPTDPDERRIFLGAKRAKG